MNERLRFYRNQKHLSQAYVASVLKISRKTMIAIEQGKSKLSANQLSTLAEIYGVSVSTLINGENMSTNLEDMNRAFCNLSEKDKKEVMDFIKFKNEQSKKICQLKK